jgi:hypothetical protein
MKQCDMWSYLMDTPQSSLLLEELRRAADVLRDSATSVQSRAGVVLGLTGTILAVSLGTASKVVLGHGAFGIPAIVVLILSMACAALAVGSVGVAWINPGRVLNGTPTESVTALEKAYSVLWRTNVLRIRRARDLMRFAVGLTTLGVALIAASVVQGGVSLAPL